MACGRIVFGYFLVRRACRKRCGTAFNCFTGSFRATRRIEYGGAITFDQNGTGTGGRLALWSVSCRSHRSLCNMRCPCRATLRAEFFRHFTCAYVDWLFVPFNLVVVRIIDWRRGGALLLIVLVSVIANIIAHATWQYYGIDGGHMISRGTQTVLPAGWVHLGFSIIETTLILAFVFIP